uniref:T9SS type A sorting domain-containing protein n=1 Tax=Flexithrix dorotheae TaxID=70993 RepID=UPI0005C762C3
GTYNIYRSINDGEFELVKELASNLTSYTDKNVVANSVAYQIEVVNPEGCGEFENGRILQYTSSKSNVARIGAVTGIEETLLENAVSIAPNPTANFIQINLNKKLSGNYSLTNLAGKEVWKGNFNSNFKIDLREYKSGVYFLNIMTDKGSIVKKVLRD